MLAAGLPIGKSLAEADLVDQARAVMRGDEGARRRRADPARRGGGHRLHGRRARHGEGRRRRGGRRRLILDIGPKTAALLADKLKSAGTIVWNGPVGVFEFDAFAKGTETIARAIAASPAFSIAGGGDTLAAIAKYGIAKDIGYISTGGGAFLEVLEGKTLPALRDPAARAPTASPSAVIMAVRLTQEQQMHHP